MPDNCQELQSGSWQPRQKQKSSPRTYRKSPSFRKKRPNTCHRNMNWLGIRSHLVFQQLMLEEQSSATFALSRWIFPARWVQRNQIFENLWSYTETVQLNTNCARETSYWKDWHFIDNFLIAISNNYWINRGSKCALSVTIFKHLPQKVEFFLTKLYLQYSELMIFSTWEYGYYGMTLEDIWIKCSSWSCSGPLNSNNEVFFLAAGQV